MKEIMVDRPNPKRDILARLKRIEGQVRGLQRMVEEENQCSDILNQVTAVKAAMAQVGVLIFQTHVRDCLSEAMESGPEQSEKMVDEIVTILSRIFK